MKMSSQATKRSFWFAAKLAISLVLLAWLTHRFDINVNSLTPARYSPLIIGLAAICAQPLVSAFRWHMLLRLYAQRLPFRETARIQYVSVFMTQFLPGFVGGEAVRIYMAHKKSVPLGTAVASAMLDRAVALLGLFLIAAAASPRILAIVDDGRLGQALLGVAAAFCTGAAVLLAASGILHRLAARRRWLSPLALLAAGLKDLLRNKRALSAALALSAAMHALSAIGLWASLHAFGQNVIFWDVLAVFAPIILLQMLPVSIGGWGVRELASVTMFSMLGVSAQQAIAASVFLGILYAIASLPGSVAWFMGKKTVPASV